MHLQLFGTFAAQVDGRPLPPQRSRKGDWLLALLALRGGGEMDRASLAGLLWPESAHTPALYNLRRALTELREVLGSEAWRLSSPQLHTLALDLTGAQIDVLAFDAALARGDEASLQSAVELYRGSLLEECAEDWTHQARLPREQAYLAALETLAGHAVARGDHAAAIHRLRQAVALDPFRETAQQALLKALVASGDLTASLLAYRDFCLRLDQEIGAEPSPETKALFHQLRAQARRRSGAVGRRAQEAAAGSSAPRRLPRPLTQFVGRETALHAVEACLASARLVTLTGPGGVGKTRLAIQVADTVADDHVDGVWFVDLSRLFEPALVPQAVASVLAVQEQSDRPLTETLADRLRTKQLLLVLDNCEHLLDASARLTAALLEGCPHLRVLATSRQSLGLSGEMVWPVSPLTQDEAMRLFVERGRAADRTFTLTQQNAAAVKAICRRLDGLPLAIELAAARLRAPGVEEIARRLDDRFRLLTSGSSTALPRHQTLRATLDWSYDLLSTAERTLLCRLSVFVGTWTLAAAEAVCGGAGIRDSVFGVETDPKSEDRTPNPESRDPEVLDLLTQLVDRSLVMAEEGEGEKRYRLLETVREYAVEQLSQEEQSALARRHAGYYLALAEQAAPFFACLEHSVGLERLGREQENLRSALAWAQTTGVEETALRLGAALWRFWKLQGHLHEGHDRLAELLALPNVQAPTAARAQALHGAGKISNDVGDAAAAMSLTTQSLVVWQQVGDQNGIADALNQLGDLELDRNELQAAQDHYEGALALYRELQDRSGIARTLYNLAHLALRQDVDAADALLAECQRLCRELSDRGLFAAVLGDQGRVALGRGDVTRARSLFEEGLTLRRELGVRDRIAWSLLDVAEAARLQRDLQASRSAAAESLAICRQIDHWPGIGWALNELGDAVYLQGEIEAAAALYEESLAVAQKLGNRRGIGALLISLGRVARRRADPAAAHTLFTEALALLRKLGHRLGEAWALEGLAEVAAAREQPEQATRLLAVAARIWEQLPGRLPSPDHESTELLLTRLRSSLGDEAFTALWESGRASGEGM